MSRKKVCHFSSVHTTIDTRVFHRECVSLAKQHEVTLIAIGKQSGFMNGVNVIAVPKPGSRIIRILRTTRTVYRLAKAQDADIYHFHDPELIPFAYLLKRKGKKVIYDVHENVTESMKAKDWLPLKFLFTWFYLLFDRLAAKHFHLILAERSYEAVYLKRYPTLSYTIIQNYAPTGQLKSYVNTNRPVDPLKIFYMGSIDHLYSCKEMIRSIAVLNDRGTRATLKLIGWLNPKLKKEIMSWPFYAGIKDQLEFIPYQQMEKGYSLALDCCIGYSFVSDNANVKESVPRKLYEYMQVGLPVISSGYPVYEAIVKENQIGVCIAENTAEAIAEKVIGLVRDPELLKAYSQNAKKVAEDRFNWQSQEKLLLDCYESGLAAI